MLLKKDLIDKQARFWVLMAGGATLTRASETVGVSRATGRNWRQATGGRIPRKRPEPSGRYLSLEERLQIADLYLGGAGVRAIAVGDRPRDAGYTNADRSSEESHLIRTLVQDYEHIHTAIGISGNLLFVVGSVLFYKAFGQHHTLAVSLFVVGSVFMLIGSLGNGLRRVWQRREE
jgi:hypothetical protein